MIDAREYLEWIESAERKIQRKLAEIDRLRSLATSIGGLATDTPVQASHEGDRIGKIVASIVDKEKELDVIVDNYIDEKDKRIKAIEQLDNELERSVLHKHYVQFKSINEIADEEYYTNKWISSIHTKALKKVGKIINSSYEFL